MENYDHCNGVIHVVEKGDTLYKLSKHYKCNLCDIITANPYVNVYNMQEGEEICIPIEQEGSGDGKMHYTVKKEIPLNLYSCILVSVHRNYLRTIRTCIRSFCRKDWSWLWIKIYKS